MASITIRNLDEKTKRRLRIRAARRNRSMEEEARVILRTTLSLENDDSGNLAASILSRFGPLGGIDLELEAREPIRQPPEPG